MADARIASPLEAGTAALTPPGDIARAILRCRESDIDQISQALGTALPREACRSTSDGGLSVLWLGPDEWLLLDVAPTDGWSGKIAARLGGTPSSFVDISHRQVALTVRGPTAEAILASGCALDLSPAAFPPGMCTRTMFAKAEIVLWRTGPDSFHVEMWRSFARYVESLLRQAETEHAVR